MSKLSELIYGYSSEPILEELVDRCLIVGAVDTLQAEVVNRLRIEKKKRRKFDIQRGINLSKDESLDSDVFDNAAKFKLYKALVKKYMIDPYKPRNRDGNNSDSIFQSFKRERY